MTAKAAVATRLPLPSGPFAVVENFAIVALPVVSWLWLCAERPSQLGFYSDDWMLLLHPFVGSASAFRDILKFAATRPASAPYIWIAQVLTDWSPARAQILNSVMLGFTAYAVGCLSFRLATIAGSPRQAALAACCLAATMFICFPSNIGTFCWGSGVIAVVPATPFFCFGMVLLLSESRRTAPPICGFALLAISHLSYEAFYFQEITIIIAALILGKTKIDSKTTGLLLIAIALNLSCIAFNRLTLTGVQKSFNVDWFNIFCDGYANLSAAFLHSVREHARWIVFNLLGTALFGSLCLSSLIGMPRVLVLWLALGCGTAAAGVLYSLAGYGLAFEGPAARVAIVIAVYSSIAIGLLSTGAWNAMRLRRPSGFIAILLTLGLLVNLNLTSKLRLSEWAATWQFEKARLARLPVEFQFRQNDTRVFLALEDHESTFIMPATAPWEIFGAVAWAVYVRSPAHDRSMMVDIWENTNLGVRWFATPPGWFNRWNGKSFAQGPCGTEGTVYESAGSEFWIWHSSESKFERQVNSWNSGCE